MQFQYSPYLLPLMGAALVSGWAAVYVGRRRAVRGAPALGLLALAVMVWSAGYALEIAGVDQPTKEFWGKVQYFGIATVPVMWFIFAFDYFNPDQRLAYRTIALLTVLPLMTLALALTNDAHHWIWSEVRVVTTGNFSTLDVSHGFWFWIYWAYSTVLLLLGSRFIVRSIVRRQGVYRRQATALLIAVLIPWVANILYVAQRSPIPNLDLTPFAFALSVVALTWAILGFQLIELLPVARNRVVEEMQDGMLVLDAQSRVVDINPAAQHLIGLSASQALGRTTTEIFSAWPHLLERFSDALEARAEITTDSGEAQRWYELRLSPLKDQRQRLLGRVLTLRNITERKRIEDKLLQERNLLRTVIDIVPDQIFARDTACRFILCNQSDAHAMGVADPETLLGKNDFDFYPADLAAQYQADDLAVMQSGRPIFNREERASDVDAQPRWVLTTKVPLYDRAEQIVGLVGIVRDITDHKRAGEVLRESKEELELRVAERTAELLSVNEHLQVQLVERQRAEAALKESSAQFRTLFEASPDAIMLIDPYNQWCIS
ncbi:MAG: PAS domain-containing protein, partial [Chloroflexi bacterium]|nr:PAS domain-containing protein [Chloroflexota bacterium]